MNSFLSKKVRNDHQLLKWQQLEELASEVKEGVIVELGTHLGYGAIALSSGSAVPVYTVDDYASKRGWSGKAYYPEEEQVFMRNCLEAGVSPILIKKDARQAGLDWQGSSISLLFWDLGAVSQLCEDFGAWSSHILKGGKFVIHDTDDNRLGSDLLRPPGWNKKKEGVFWILQKEQ